MKEFGLAALGRSIVEVTFAEMAQPYDHAMGAVRCAQAAEIILKARIAEEHPLLIFSKLPKMTQEPDKLLGDAELLTDGKTLMYSDLPDTLWAATGYRLPLLDQYYEFGRVRNMLTHFAVPKMDLSQLTLRFAFTVLEPAIFNFWKSNIFEYVEIYDPDATEYVLEQLALFKIPFQDRSG